MAWWRRLLRRSKCEEELEKELSFHLDQHTSDLVAQGHSPEEARRRARLALGGPEQVKEMCRDARGVRLLGDLWQDLRYGARSLVKSPGFSVIVILTLAIGIGANTAIFSVVNALLLRSLPYREPERLMKVLQTSANPGKTPATSLWSYMRFKALREQNESFESVAAYAKRAFNLTGTDEPEHLQGEYVSGNYFSLLGVDAAAGRAFLPEEDETPGSHPVAVISHGLWQRRFGGDPQVVGQSIELDKHRLTIVGVLPKGFKGQSGAADLWLPMMMAPTLLSPQLISQPYFYWAEVIARLKPDVTRPQAQAAMEALHERLEKSLPSPKVRPSGSGRETFTLVPLKDANVDPAIRRSFLILLAAVGFVLLIACANTAGLLLARAVTRRREFAIRLALGASRGRIVRQLLVESTLLAVAGGGAGSLVALWGVELLTCFKPTDAAQFWTAYARTFQFYTVRMDAVVLAFNFILSVATGLLFGLLPAWQATRADVNEALKDGAGRAGAGARRRFNARSWLVVAEISLSLVLLAGAGLMINSLIRLNSIKLGFEPRDVLTMRVQSRDAKTDFYEQLLERVAALPGVESAAVAGVAPLFGSVSSAPMNFEGESTNGDANRAVSINVISPDYFKTLGIKVIRGRGFTDQDRVGAGRVALISRAAAEIYWPGQDPTGKRIQLPYGTRDLESTDPIEIVGVVDDVKYGRVEELAEPVVYLSYLQPLEAPSQLVLRAVGDREALVRAMRREVYALDKNMPVYDVKSMTERAAEMTSRTRFSALLLAVFAAIALVLSAIGVYGVMAYTVAQRTHEIGVRMALGAQGRDVLRMIVGEGLLLTLIGVALGLAAAFAVTRVIRGMLYEVSTTDPMTFIVVSALLVFAAMLSSLIPAHRAAKVDPLIALRTE